jgi:hypothetical protein
MAARLVRFLYWLATIIAGGKRRGITLDPGAMPHVARTR